MRIIAGQARGRRLKSFDGDKIRPTSDRVKEALFNMLGHRLSGKKVLDLFAGTGSLGLEALSRGAAHVTFVDTDINAYRLITSNIALLGFQDNTEVCVTDAFKAINGFASENRMFDIVFIDPPYRSSLYEKAVRYILDYDVLENEGIVVVEHPADLCLNDTYNSLCVLKSKRYGSTCITIYFKGVSNENSDISGKL